jgi:hypothetical protein
LFGVLFRAPKPRPHDLSPDANLHVVAGPVAEFTDHAEFDGLFAALRPVVEVRLEVHRFVDLVDGTVLAEHAEYRSPRGFESVVEVHGADQGLQRIADDSLLDIGPAHL